ncbi:hypothetical protein [Bifidobacterium psychraerophilum]|jgi:hypothetical protein|uniref:hypothetical protein n=1 Tax=Bifidobacterium psychraerophilum TaxID=218140 RepID=UPI0023F366DC|nr:hypothetical protein [Bifidobacterium psychraerophilum]MCI1660053.1 hypothetical protein [Bifidobacterium psychraerophilum]MCI1804928.1 hypothetical protein [Bifidobacterium psychraerophilum]MCI2177206.1 hypothetical protein [Bifidobacterium psychraerophilum]MCI2183041.1 hypothetical protein [Bifidobacterium psychraerophilum]
MNARINPAWAFCHGIPQQFVTEASPSDEAVTTPVDAAQHDAHKEGKALVRGFANIEGESAINDADNDLADWGRMLKGFSV